MALAELAERQHGVVARRQLGALGLSPTMVRDRIEQGHLLRLHRGVYAVGHRRLRREGWWMAAVLAAGPRAVLSHRDAAALHGLRRPGDHVRWEVTTSGRAASTPALRVRRSEVLAPQDRTTVGGIPVTSVARTLVDLAGVVSVAQLRRALAEAERQHRFDLRAIEDAMARTAGRKGAGHARLHAALAGLEAVGERVTRSRLERRFLALLAAHGLPRPLTNHWLEGQEVDACWPRERVTVELDGWDAHRTREAFQTDRTRSNALQGRGWIALRLTWADVSRQPQATAATVRAALARGRRYPPSP